MAKLEIYDPPMCCSSGVCGPHVDKNLVRFNAALEWLKRKGLEVQRYNPAQEYEAFLTNPEVVRTINERGNACLPLLMFDGEIISMGGYPELDELAAMAGLELEESS